MKTFFSYLRLLVASCLFIGGLALVIGPSAAEAQREIRFRNHEWRNANLDDRLKQDLARDEEQAWVERSWRILGVFLGGLGFTIALHEAGFVLSQFMRAKE